MYLSRYPGLRPEKCLLIPNGYDEENFKDLIIPGPVKNTGDHPIRLIHAGLIYPEDRDPRPFFRALSRLKQTGEVSATNLRVELRASGSEEYFREIIRELEIADLVHLLPPLPYHESLQNCAYADALLLFQAASCNHQIPAKVYEYLRLRKPILALTDDIGDTAALLRETGGASIVSPSDERIISPALVNFLGTVRDGTFPLPGIQRVECYTRKNQTRDLATCLLDVVKPELSV